MRRLPDWDSRLAEYLIKCRGKSYHPLTFYCGGFVAGAISAQTGQDIYAPYDSTGSFSDFCSTVAKRLGFREVPPLQAMRGDPVASAPAEGSGLDLALGLCVGSQALFLDEHGLRPKDLADCLKGWRI